MKTRYLSCFFSNGESFSDVDKKVKFTKKKIEMYMKHKALVRKFNIPTTAA